MLNIRSRAVQTTLTFPLLDADDTPLLNEDGTPCTATIHGPGSKRYAAALAARQARLMAKVSKGKAPTFTADEQLRYQAEFLAAITEDIGLAYDDLQGQDKLLAIYGDLELGYIADQVAKKAGDWANFSKGSAKS